MRAAVPRVVSGIVRSYDESWRTNRRGEDAEIRTLVFDPRAFVLRINSERPAS